jgi:hypothetical protein
VGGSFLNKLLSVNPAPGARDRGKCSCSMHLPQNPHQPAATRQFGPSIKLAYAWNVEILLQ